MYDIATSERITEQWSLYHMAPADADGAHEFARQTLPALSDSDSPVRTEESLRDFLADPTNAGIFVELNDRLLGFALFDRRFEDDVVFVVAKGRADAYTMLHDDILMRARMPFAFDPIASPFDPIASPVEGDEVPGDVAEHVAEEVPEVVAEDGRPARAAVPALSLADRDVS